MPRLTITEPGGKNVMAFLDTLALSEIGPALLAESDDGYDVLVGATLDHPLRFDSYATHPNILNQALHSTAAGRYQVLYRIWAAYAPQLNLPDFGPTSQDLIAVQLLHECGAYAALIADRFPHAVQLAASRWASLPGNDYRQATRSLDQLGTWYVRAGGGRVV